MAEFIDLYAECRNGVELDEGIERGKFTKKLYSKQAEILISKTRAPLYPDLAEQFDLLWHAIDDGTLDKTSSFYTTLKKVKDDNSYPERGPEWD